MANNQKLYVVSFGHSDKYLLKASQEEAQSKLSEIEQWLNKMLRHDFPEDSFAYFTTPRVTEVNPEHEAKFAEYHMLDKAALDEIASYLRKEVANMEDQHHLNLDAPFSDAKGVCAPVNTNLGKDPTHQ